VLDAVQIGRLMAGQPLELKRPPVVAEPEPVREVRVEEKESAEASCRRP